MYNDDTKQKAMMKLSKKQYLFKSMNEETITCLDDNFEEIVFSLNGLSLDEMKQIKEITNKGGTEKKDVNIVVVETQTKNNNMIRKVSHAILT